MAFFKKETRRSVTDRRAGGATLGYANIECSYLAGPIIFLLFALSPPLFE